MFILQHRTTAELTFCIHLTTLRYFNSREYTKTTTTDHQDAGQYPRSQRPSNESQSKDLFESVWWFRLAGEQGYGQAQYNLGLMYSRGEGVQKDDKEAVKWYHLSAEQGISGAQSNLGLMYEKGLGVKQDYIEAHKWFNIAGVNGNATGKKNADIIEKKMQPGQIITAIGLAREWLEKI